MAHYVAPLVKGRRVRSRVVVKKLGSSVNDAIVVDVEVAFFSDALPGRERIAASKILS